MTLVELLVIVGTIACAIYGAMTLGHWLGWVGYALGLVGGGAAITTLIYVLLTLHDLIWWGRPPLPACRNGKCKADDYELRCVGEEFDWFCKCGTRYRKKPRRLYEVRSDGSLGRYMIWKPFRGWFPDVH